MKYLSALCCVLLLCGCVSNPYGKVPDNITIAEEVSFDSRNPSVSVIICADAGGTYDANGLAKPTLRLYFTDAGYNYTKTSYQAVRLNSAKRSFAFRMEFGDQHSVLRVEDFEFEPGTTYHARYVLGESKMILWIEKDNGVVVYGRRPEKSKIS